jgi:hypothetical protein
MGRSKGRSAGLLAVAIVLGVSAEARAGLGFGWHRHGGCRHAGFGAGLRGHAEVHWGGTMRRLGFYGGPHNPLQPLSGPPGYWDLPGPPGMVMTPHVGAPGAPAGQANQPTPEHGEAEGATSNAGAGGAGEESDEGGPLTPPSNRP